MQFSRNLVMHFRATSVEGEERMKVSAVGSDLFYYASTLMNDDTDFYPPTRQLLSSLLEVLGHEFISTLPNQSHRLVTTAIRNPKLVGALAPHLNLASCSPQVLIQVYKEVVSVPKKNVDLAFVILTKVIVIVTEDSNLYLQLSLLIYLYPYPFSLISTVG